jgi:hypothetical protein|tara:strand:- start:41 stop:397 length:357 start_codon:yes stop_codon:yes gene_type:complete
VTGHEVSDSDTNTGICLPAQSPITHVNIIVLSEDFRSSIIGIFISFIRNFSLDKVTAPIFPYTQFVFDNNSSTASLPRAKAALDVKKNHDTNRLFIAFLYIYSPLKILGITNTLALFV